MPLVGHTNDPIVLRSETVITAEMKNKLVSWQEETGIHMHTLGNIIHTLGLAALGRILNDKDQRRELNSEVERIEEIGPPEGQEN